MKNVPISVIKDWKGQDFFPVLQRAYDEEEKGALNALLNLCSVSDDAEVRGAHARWQQLNSITQRMRDPK